MISGLRKIFWLAFYLLTGGGTSFYVLHLLRPAQDASTPPLWGRGAREVHIPAAGPVSPPNVARYARQPEEGS